MSTISVLKAGIHAYSHIESAEPDDFGDRPLVLLPGPRPQDPNVEDHPSARRASP